MLTTGLLLDIYPAHDQMVCWIKQQDGNNVRLEDSWTPSIYVAADDEADLKTVLQDAAAIQLVKGHDFVRRREKITDLDKTIVLKLTLSDPAKAPTLARSIERLGKFGRFRLYNVDVPPAQSYLYQYDLFSLAHCSAHAKGSRLAWNLMDNVWLPDYKLPNFARIHLGVRVKKESGLPKFTDRIESIIIKEEKGGVHEISNSSEADMLADLESKVARLDPDFISTQDGDTFLFPYLISRAEQNDISLSLSRDNVPMTHSAREGTSYFSYGKIHFKPASVRLYGRVHVDLSNSFIWDEADMQGLYEVARTCRMPLHTAARASIGRCMSSLQFYHATKKGILIPWKPMLVERFKTYQELLVADRGGFIFEPEIGVHEKVAEFDFASLYANIMMRKNLSAETVRCECCPDSKERVPELNYNICERRGITPISLEILIKKRAEYKQLRKDEADTKKKKIYDERQNALKWILVTSFGYLGFNNAKFGRIDAHIAVCAFDRHVFLQASKIAERLGFRVLHGIVDSLWVQKRNATDSDYVKLKNTIERETGFEISFEGVYKWIAFVHSKESSKLPVANRYFGAFEDGSLKIRGIEARRHDTPLLFEKFQLEILKIMAGGSTIAEVRALMPQVQATFAKYARLLKDRRVPMNDLIFVKNVSKDTDQHSERNTVENDALGRLAKEGKMLKAGQTLRYIISDYGKNARKAIPLELVDERTTFDPDRYIELLAKTCNSVTEPFGYVVQADDY